MTTFILAAGMGKRMGKLTEEQPKCMVPLFGRPILHRQIDVLRKANVENIIVLSGYCAEKVEPLGCRVVNNDRYSETNMVSTLFCAEEFMNPDDDLIISYGDIVYEFRVLEALLNCNAPLCIAVDKAWKEYWFARMDNPLEDAETLKFAKDNRIAELGKKATSYDEIQGQYIGLIKVSKSYISMFRKVWHEMDRNALYDGKTFDNMYMTSFIQHLINLGWDVRASFTSNGWLEIDTQSDLQIYEKMESEGLLNNFYQVS